MQYRHRRLLLVMIVLLGAAVGLINQALAETFTEFPVPTALSFPRGITAGPDGALWFTEADGGKIGRITTAGVITNEFPIPLSSVNPYGITRGPDGALWFVDGGTGPEANTFGRITTSGTVTTYHIASDPNEITSGSDGALWFTEGIASKIGRSTTAGVATAFLIPTVNSMPEGIAAGPDGALWFTENTGNNIGRITTAGAITEFVIPTASSGPLKITAGPDGALWFTEAAANKIGRITTAGVITEFDIPTAKSKPHSITAGPDGALWFTENLGNKIGRITTAGVITEFDIPTANSEPFGITAGPDAGLWFTEGVGNKIGRLSLPTLQVAPATSIAASGPQGGPFSPTSFSYQLASANGNVNYSISGIPSWLNASFTSGTVTTSPVTVTFSLMNVGSFNPGTYNATITFTNKTNGQGNTSRTAVLTVTFAGVPGSKNCHGTSVSALAKNFGGLQAAATALGYPNVDGLQKAIDAYCGG
jgi:streptogramin lyase